MQKENERVATEKAQKAQLDMDLILQKAQESEMNLKRELKNICTENESLKIKINGLCNSFLLFIQNSHVLYEQEQMSMEIATLKVELSVMENQVCFLFYKK